jgi:hypothetical protein
VPGRTAAAGRREGLFDLSSPQPSFRRFFLKELDALMRKFDRKRIDPGIAVLILAAVAFVLVIFLID